MNYLPLANTYFTDSVLFKFLDYCVAVIGFFAMSLFCTLCSVLHMSRDCPFSTAPIGFLERLFVIVNR
jgi:hypothetical protein